MNRKKNTKENFFKLESKWQMLKTRKEDPKYWQKESLKKKKKIREVQEILKTIPKIYFKKKKPLQIERTYYKPKNVTPNEQTKTRSGRVSVPQRRNYFGHQKQNKSHDYKAKKIRLASISRQHWNKMSSTLKFLRKESVSQVEKGRDKLL